jgi:hypothetical protein
MNSNDNNINNNNSVMSNSNDIFSFYIHPIINDLRNKKSNTILFTVISIIFIYVWINRYFTEKNIISFVPLIILAMFLYFIISGMDQSRTSWIDHANKNISSTKYPHIYKYPDILHIFNDLSYLNHYNPISFTSSLVYANKFLDIYDFVRHKLQMNTEISNTYQIVSNAKLFYTSCLNALSSIVVNMPSYSNYDNNVLIQNALPQDMEHHITNLQNIFINLMNQIINYTNSLGEENTNINVQFNDEHDLIVVPNPLDDISYNPSFNLY